MGITVNKKSHSKINVETLKFLKNNVLNVTDLTRNNKLSEILDDFSGGISEEVYVVQNAKKKNANAVLIDLEYFEQLLIFKEILEESLDQSILKEAYNRKNKPATHTISDVFDENDINIKEILQQIEDVE